MVDKRKVEMAPKPEQIPFYQPQRVSLPTRVIPKKGYITVLDQGEEGACVGVALAEFINYLTARSGGNPFQASPRMLEVMARTYDGMGNKSNLNMSSHLWSGLYGLKKHGVTTEEIWPYYPRIENPNNGDDILTEERKELASQFKLQSYERLPKNIRAVKAAVVERGAVLAYFLEDENWIHPSDGVIRLLSYRPEPTQWRENSPFGHAVNILGYTPDGFIILNTRGESWGNVVLEGWTYPGMAILTYPAFEANFLEAYVARLWPGVPSLKPYNVRAGYTSDSPKGGNDYLNIMPDVRAISAVLAAKDIKPPLALGLFGNWGTGKSFFMEKMKKEIDRLSTISEKSHGNSPYCQPIIQIEFNAWHYLDTNLWASLVSEVFDHLHERIRPPEAPLEETRRKLIEKLGEAEGLYRQSELELKEAQQDLHIAETSLIISKMAQALNAKFASTSDEINNQVQQLLTLRVRIRTIWNRLFKEKDKKLRNRRWQLLGLALLGTIVVGLIPTALSAAYPATFNQVLDWVNVSWTWAIGLLTWLGVQWRTVGRFLGDLKDKSSFTNQLTDKQKTNIAEDLSKNKDENGNIDFQATVIEAEDKREKAKQRLEQVQKELASLSPRWQMQQYIVERSASQDYRSQLGLVSLIRRDFEKMSSLLESCEKESSAAEGEELKDSQPKLPFERIILYIDDLDRCTPKRVVEVLEAVHLLLAFPLFVVVVAVDPRWLRNCLEITYPTLSMQSIEREEVLDIPATPQDYLEKIFQIPFYLRPMDSYGYGSMIRGLVEPDVDLEANSRINQEIDLMEKTVNNGRENGPLGSSTDELSKIDGIKPPKIGEPEKKKEEDFQQVNPDLLKFKSWELDDLQRLSPMFRTPRAVKRFINTYRLVKAGIDPADIYLFEGDRDYPGTSRIAQTLLAVVAGYPNEAPRFLQRLIAEANSSNPSSTWKEFLLECKNQPSFDQMRSENKSLVAGEKEWLKMCDALLNISEDYFGASDLSFYIEMVKRVACFSFSVSDLPTLREIK